MNNTTDDLHNQILNKIKNQKPYASWRFQMVNFGVVLLLTVLISVCIFGLTLFVWDLEEVDKITRLDWLELLSAGLLELVALVIFLSGVIFFLYKKTEFVYVKSGIAVLVGIIAIITGSSIAGIWAIHSIPELNRTFENISKQIERGRPRGNRMKNLLLRKNTLKQPRQIESSFENGKVLESDSTSAIKESHEN